MDRKLKIDTRWRKNFFLNWTIWFVWEIRMGIYRLICVAFSCSQTADNDGTFVFEMKNTWISINISLTQLCNSIPLPFVIAATSRKKTLSLRWHSLHKQSGKLHLNHSIINSTHRNLTNSLCCASSQHLFIELFAKYFPLICYHISVNDAKCFQYHGHHWIRLLCSGVKWMQQWNGQTINTEEENRRRESKEMQQKRVNVK